MTSASRPPRRPHRRDMLNASAKPIVARPANTPAKAGKPRGKRPAESVKTSRRPIQIHSRREPLKWSFGGLTVSLRLLAVLVVVGMLVVTLVPLGLQWMKQEQAYRAVLAEVAAAEEQAQELQERLDEWENEDFIAGQARERLGYVREGETQFVVTDAPERPDNSTKDDGRLDAKGQGKPWMWQLADALEDADQPPPSSALTEVNAPGNEAREDD